MIYIRAYTIHLLTNNRINILSLPSLVRCYTYLPTTYVYGSYVMACPEFMKLIFGFYRASVACKGIIRNVPPIPISTYIVHIATCLNPKFVKGIIWMNKLFIVCFIVEAASYNHNNTVRRNIWCLRG